MAFVLDRIEDMKAIYDAAKKVYNRDIAANAAVRELVEKTDSQESSLQMYLNIYACMRKGKTYKMGTSESFTQFLLEHILHDEGADAFRMALIAVKGNAAYRESKGNAQPGLRRACINAINKSGLGIDYDSIIAGEWIEASEISISEDDLCKLRESINLPNADYAKVIMEMLEKYQVMTANEISLLTDQVYCSSSFRSSYPLLKEISPNVAIEEQIKDALGKKRYYNSTYSLLGSTFVFTSQLYGLGRSPTMRDNRTPFLEWVIERFTVARLSADSDKSGKIIKTGTFDSWEIIDENTAIKHCDKSFFEYRGSGVPKGICWFFGAVNMEPGKTKMINLIYDGRQYQGSIKTESIDRRRVRISWSTELGYLFDAFNTPDSAATFKRVSDNTYEVFIKGGEKEMTTKEKVAAIKAYISAKGFNYEGDLIENYYLSLKSKPFVILAGTSGTGKTRLVKLFAEAIGAKMLLVPVRPDWSDSSDLFGHNDLSGNFHPGAIIDFIKQAGSDITTPHFLCLDEMNLARVEYYLSDFLSIIETRDRDETGAIVTDALVDSSYFQSQSAQEEYGRISIPENLYIIGTVNMDETTFPFSKKVLDRANTIEFSFVNLMARVPAARQAIAQRLDNSFLKANYLYLQDCDDEDLIDMVCFNLEELNQVLVKANQHIGYRIRDEIFFYMMNNKEAELLDSDVAFDHEIMQKILPRVQGSSASIKDVLSELFIRCAGDFSGFVGAAAYEQMTSYLASRPCKYPNSAKKIAFMMRRYEEDGFTSYWL